MAIFHGSTKDPTNIVNWKFLTPFTRFWGIMTSIVMFGVGVDQYYHHYSLGVYIMLISFGIFTLEISWIVNQFIKVYRIEREVRTNHKCWKFVLRIQFWQKSVVYLIVSIIFFIRPHKLWLCEMAGIAMIMLSGLYTLLSVQYYLETYQEKISYGRQFLYEQFPLNFTFKEEREEEEEEEIEEEEEEVHETYRDQDNNKGYKYEPGIDILNDSGGVTTTVEVEILEVDDDSELEM